VTAVLVAAVAGCGSSGGGNPYTSAVIKNFLFSPATMTVRTGSTVAWLNQDQSVHTVTADGGGFDSQAMAQGLTYRHTFTAAGRYPYHCDIHQYMKGTVVVQD
jgi:plastocyanin